MKVKKNPSGGACITGLLQGAFIALKLRGIIKWSWWWVLCPTWGSISLVILLVIACVLLADK